MLIEGEPGSLRLENALNLQSCPINCIEIWLLLYQLTSGNRKRLNPIREFMEQCTGCMADTPGF